MAIDRTGASALVRSVPTGLLIDGRFTDAADGATFDVFNPATEEHLATLASAGENDAREALDVACRVQGDWARTPARHRSEILRRAFALVHERAEDFATLMTLEMGKPLAEARGEVTYGAEYLRWFAEEAVRDHGRFDAAPEGGLRMLTRRKPVGPCLLITPWNFPLAMATRKIAPAVAAGCTMILKPADLTPLTSHFFAQTMMDAGLPAGVLAVLPGADPAAVSAPLLADDRLRKVSFTGSTRVGKLLLRQAADGVLRTSMELGGNAPFIVFDDADIDAAVEGAMAAKMRNIGEACTAANRFIVHESVAGRFAALFAERMNTVRLGDGLEPGVTCGPLVSRQARDRVAELVDDAVGRGAKALTGGSPVPGPGWFYPPTVLVDVPACARVLTEEIFGPVAPIITFRDEEEALALANDTEYGLASYVFTADASRMYRMADGLDFGLMGFNAGVISNAAAPFGGVKQSGLGREGGAEGLDEYTSVQYIGVADPYV
ncbi:NAD-dependent succinate-semialdehyde dehydrogenase [Corynebacterium sp. CCM 9186]|uniref:NAD-dependent succinate-semialdehyde dehydrogenase n=1 Tax=Corynebacterium meridianum TaxID=2765363 RepID=UPI002006038E|nr:NAD-dependent succinate-semialdehyde dehydrogenase [Corynebacterium meridianum]MCK7677108.1 NAD-dependent succinate-semialdehyde dehydrogenase [Corynebacterium meridianum]